MTVSIFTASQVWLPLTGLPAMYFMSKKSKWGPFFGLLGQPAWVFSAVHTGQWGMLSLSLAYAVMWVLTAYRWWSKPMLLDERRI